MLNEKILHSLEPGEALGVPVSQGAKVRVINPQGHQVVDLWAFVGSSSTEYLSMAHNRTALYTTRFQAGDVLVSNRFAPMLRFSKDTTDGFHDSFHAACSAHSYAFFGEGQQYPNCEDNLRNVLEDAGIDFLITPPPWNLFEKSFVNKDGSLSDGATSAGAGDFVELIAECDLFMAFSACRSTVGNIQNGKPAGAKVWITEYATIQDDS